MAFAHQIEALSEGLEPWNRWRQRHPDEVIELSHADLRHVDIGLLDALRKVNDERHFLRPGMSWSFIYNEIIGVDFMPLNLRGANLRHSRLDGLDLRKADCRGADFSGASLVGTDLHRAELSWARFVDADLSGADVRASDLTFASFVRTTVEGTDLGLSDVYGIATWDLKGTPRDETGLQLLPPGKGSLRADGLAMAPYVNFFLGGEQTRQLIDAYAKHVVLILGSFRADRKAVLDLIGAELRRLGHRPLIFDFEGPSSQDTTGTVETLARLSRFVIADLTAASSVPHELATIVPHLRKTPVVLLQHLNDESYGMAGDLEAYEGWVFPLRTYETPEQLSGALPQIVEDASRRAGLLRSRAPRRAIRPVKA